MAKLVTIVTAAPYCWHLAIAGVVLGRSRCKSEAWRLAKYLVARERRRADRAGRLPGLALGVYPFEPIPHWRDRPDLYDDFDFPDRPPSWVNPVRVPDRLARRRPESAKLVKGKREE
jgi:hypothetical protein